MYGCFTCIHTIMHICILDTQYIHICIKKSDLYSRDVQGSIFLLWGGLGGVGYNFFVCGVGRGKNPWAGRGKNPWVGRGKNTWAGLGKNPRGRMGQRSNPP